LESIEVGRIPGNEIHGTKRVVPELTCDKSRDSAEGINRRKRYLALMMGQCGIQAECGRIAGR
jgi:hypothetical protein